MPDPPVNSLMRHLWASHGKRAVYAILDTARHEAIYTALVKANVSYCCLYQGPLSPELAATAPYLVQLHRQDPFTRWVLEEGRGDSWGICLISSAGLNDLRRHFRRFLMVKDSEGAMLYFRYYDPRVLRVYLPTCHTQEVQFVFGPVTQYWVEAEENDTVLVFSHTYGKLIQDKVVLNA